VWKGCADESVWTMYVYVELRTRVLDVRLLDGSDKGVSCVVDDGVDTSLFFGDTFYGIVDGVSVGNVERQGFADIDTVGVACRAVDAPSVRPETPGCRLTDSARRTRDQDGTGHS
jgi:hypothetical protein